MSEGTTAHYTALAIISSVAWLASICSVSMKPEVFPIITTKVSVLESIIRELVGRHVNKLLLLEAFWKSQRAFCVCSFEITRRCRARRLSSIKHGDLEWLIYVPSNIAPCLALEVG